MAAGNFCGTALSAAGTEKLQTGRYTFTVQDVAHPELDATTSILLKKPEFTLTVKPNQASYGDYVELIGNAEQGSGSVRVDVVDTAGKISHTFMAPVGADGYFDFGFHVDMQPGRYHGNGWQSFDGDVSQPDADDPFPGPARGHSGRTRINTGYHHQPGRNHTFRTCNPGTTGTVIRDRIDLRLHRPPRMRPYSWILQWPGSHPLP